MLALEKSVEQLLLRLLEHHQYAVILLDADARIRYLNPGATRLFNRTLDQAIGQPLSILFTSEDVEQGVPDYEIAAARSHGSSGNDRWMMRADGSRFWAMGSLMSLHDPDGQLVGFGKILRDRTDIREQIETLLNQAAQSDDSSHQKDVFLSTLSHELRGPLAPLSNALQIVRMKVGGQPDLDRPLTLADRQLEKMRRLVDDLLDVSRISAGKLDLQKAPVSLHEILQRAVESTRPLVEQRGHHLEIIMPPGPVVVLADAARLEQVFVNLISNAAKYTPEAGRIWVAASMAGNEALVHVTDNGVGIPHDMLPKIFELFTQVESSRAQSRGGLGIGLSLVKQLVTLHGGSVQVRSDGEGQGAEFSVRLPLHRA
jgi:two-component system CheB/CheR fusion protein